MVIGLMIFISISQRNLKIGNRNDYATEIELLLPRPHLPFESSSNDVQRIEHSDDTYSVGDADC